MVSVLILLAATLVLTADPSPILVERVDLFNPSTGLFLGTERTYYGPDGRRLRLEITDAEGEPTLQFFALHEDSGRETEAIYFEGGEPTPYRETFTYAKGDRLKITTYLSADGTPGARTESDLNGAGREVRKRYYREDASQYGEEDVLWNDDGTSHGWTFRRVGSEGEASFRYAYDEFDQAGRWTRRTRSRDGTVERVETRTLTTASSLRPHLTPAPFAPGVVSTDESETSPSFSRDGEVLVFARYGGDWAKKDPFIARLGDAGWQVEPIPGIGPVYNLAISPDGEAVVYAAGSGDSLFRVRFRGNKWSEPEDLTGRYGVKGTYPALTESGDLLVYDRIGESGDGIYVARRDGEGFGPVKALYVPDEGTTFDGFAFDEGRRLLVTRCLDDACEPGPDNGVWEVNLEDPDAPVVQKVSAVPYVWGTQAVESLGLLVFTDGEDILAVPLSAGGLGR